MASVVEAPYSVSHYLVKRVLSFRNGKVTPKEEPPRKLVIAVNDRRLEEELSKRVKKPFFLMDRELPRTF